MKFSYDIGWLPNNMEYAEIFKAFKSAGIDTLAYNFFCLNNRTEVLSADSYIVNAGKIRDLLDSQGMSCNQSYAPFSLKLCDERINRFEPCYGELVRALEFSAILGAKQMVCYAVQVPCDTSQVDKNYKIYRSLIPYCEKFGIKIAICSGFPKYIDSSVLNTPWKTAEGYVRFINSFDSPYICACAHLGAISGFSSPPESFVSALGGTKLSSIHWSDTEKYHDVHLPAYFKQFDWVKLVKTFKNIGYEGELTFECPDFMQKYPKELLGAICGLFADIGNYITGLAKGDI